MGEVWKVVEGFSRYEVSDKGNVKEISTGRLMPQTVNGDFWCTNLYSDTGTKVLCKVHRLVAIAFIPNTEEVHNVEHKGDRLNNEVGNIQWRPKKVKPVKIEEKIAHLGKEYTYDEFATFCSTDKSTIKLRLRSGWATVECVVGRRNFTGEGISYDGYWFPLEKDFKAYQRDKKVKAREQTELDRLAGIQQRIESRLVYRKFGVGNFVNYPIPGIVNRRQLKVYRVWSGMISRCYNIKNSSYDRYGGRGVYVCDEWLEFQDFAVWYYEQYQEDSWHMDKDILSPVDDVRYSPETCVFIPAVLNTLLATMEGQSRDLPTGVIKTKTKDVYSCQYKVDGKRQAKRFTSVYEAALHYKKHKEVEIKRLTEKYKNVLPEKVYQFFINYSIEIRDEFKIHS